MAKLPFQPKPGQIDYTNARWAPVVNSVIKYKDKILIVHRSPNSDFYPNLWNGIAGFLDDDKSIEEKVREEIWEELGLTDKQITSIKQLGIFEQDEPAYKKTWIVHPCLVEVNTDKIKLDREAQDSRWVSISEALTYDLVPSFDEVLRLVENHIAKH